MRKLLMLACKAARDVERFVTVQRPEFAIVCRAGRSSYGRLISCGRCLVSITLHLHRLYRSRLQARNFVNNHVVAKTWPSTSHIGTAAMAGKGFRRNLCRQSRFCVSMGRKPDTSTVAISRVLISIMQRGDNAPSSCVCHGCQQELLV